MRGRLCLQSWGSFDPARAGWAEHEEIAQIMECPVGTVRSRIFRGAGGYRREKISPLLDKPVELKR